MESIEESISWENGIGFDFKRCIPGMAFLIKSEDVENNEGVCYFVGLDPIRDDHYVFAKEAKTVYFSLKESRLYKLLRFPSDDIKIYTDHKLDELDKKVCTNIGYVVGYIVTLVRVVVGSVNRFIRKVF